MNYLINEIFLSLQGEGYNQGKEVIFLRFAKCNLACSWCDTDYHSGVEMSISEIIQRLEEYDCKSVLLTGGEPTIYNLLPLLNKLKNLSYWIAIESNGTNDLSGYRNLIDHITISPKQHYKPQPTDELRVVNTHLGINQLAHYETSFDAKYYFLSPLEKKGEMNIYNTMHLVGLANEKLSKRWGISIQLHKLANIP